MGRKFDKSILISFDELKVIKIINLHKLTHTSKGTYGCLTNLSILSKCHVLRYTIRLPRANMLRKVSTLYSPVEDVCAQL